MKPKQTVIKAGIIEAEQNRGHTGQIQRTLLQHDGASEETDEAHQKLWQ